MDIKQKLTDLYKLTNYSRSPKATDISDWFEIKAVKIYQAVEGKKKQFKGYELIKNLNKNKLKEEGLSYMA